MDLLCSKTRKYRFPWLVPCYPPVCVISGDSVIVDEQDVSGLIGIGNAVNIGITPPVHVLRRFVKTVNTGNTSHEAFRTCLEEFTCELKCWKCQSIKSWAIYSLHKKSGKHLLFKGKYIRSFSLGLVNPSAIPISCINLSMDIVK